MVIFVALAYSIAVLDCMILLAFWSMFCRWTWLSILSPAYLLQKTSGIMVASGFKIHKTYLDWISKFPWREHWKLVQLSNILYMKPCYKSSNFLFSYRWKLQKMKRYIKYRNTAFDTAECGFQKSLHLHVKKLNCHSAIITWTRAYGSGGIVCRRCQHMATSWD